MSEKFERKSNEPTESEAEANVQAIVDFFRTTDWQRKLNRVSTGETAGDNKATLTVVVNKYTGVPVACIGSTEQGSDLLSQPENVAAELQYEPSYVSTVKGSYTIDKPGSFLAGKVDNCTSQAQQNLKAALQLFNQEHTAAQQES